MTDTIATSHPYDRLDPDTLLQAIESFGLQPDGHVLALNSYENRVYQVGIEGETPVVAKFYRPARWSDEQILEEHHFTMELSEREIPVVAPLQNADGCTLREFSGFRFAVYPRRGGRAPDLDSAAHLRWLGRFIGRIHGVGSITPFRHRPALTVAGFGRQALDELRASEHLPQDMAASYLQAAEQVLDQVDIAFENAGPLRRLRLHGDCHPGNVLWTDDGPHFVDFDDARTGPAIQDLWMLLSGEREEMTVQLSHLIAGYTEFHPFDGVQLQLVEPLRSLRLIHFAGWLAKRWSDPAFPRAFPWFKDRRYWEEQIGMLHEQLRRMDEPPLPWLPPD